jgi:SAM-dependent methyltransferase
MITEFLRAGKRISRKLRGTIVPNGRQKLRPDALGSPFLELRQDLVDFTGLPVDIVDSLLTRPHGLAYMDEWAATPALLRFDHWFYLTSRFYLFGNAVHAHKPGSGFLTADELERIVPPAGCVLDYAGGTGNSALATAKLGYHAHYRELSSIQADFVRFRSWKHNIPLTIHSWWEPLEKDHFDLVCFDSIGHVVDQRGVLLELIEATKHGGALFLNLDDFSMPTSYDVTHAARWKAREGEQSMHITNQVGNVSSVLEERGLRWVGPHWVKPE